MDHTIPRVPAGAGMGAAVTTTTISSIQITYIPNTVTGDETATSPVKEQGVEP